LDTWVGHTGAFHFNPGHAYTIHTTLFPITGVVVCTGETIGQRHVAKPRFRVTGRLHTWIGRDITGHGCAGAHSIFVAVVVDCAGIVVVAWSGCNRVHALTTHRVTVIKGAEEVVVAPLYIAGRTFMLIIAD
jgi:transposase InsO family protein